MLSLLVHNLPFRIGKAVEDHHTLTMDLWQQYWDSPSIDNRNALVMAHIEIVYNSVGKYNPDNRDMLFGYAVEGLIQAVERYLPKVGKFSAYAYQRVKGAIKDGWRDIDYLTRGARRNIATYIRAREALAQQRGQVMGDTTIVTALNLDRKSRYRTAAAIDFATLRLDARSEAALNVAEVDRELNPESSIVYTTVRDWLGDLVSQLHEKQKLVITLYYYEDMRLREIGEVLGVSESRACKIHTDALRTLRKSVTDISVLYAIA